MKRVFVGVAAALVLSMGHAAAEGLPPTGRIRAPEMVGPVWTGFFIGAGLGAGSFNQDISANYSCRTCGYYGSASGDADLSSSGVFGTIALGYDRVIRPGWVAGVFADVDVSNMSSDFSVSAGPATFHGSIDHDYSFAVGGRLGYLTNPGTLLYGTAGYTRAQFDIEGAGSQNFDGYFVGAGIETFLRQNWSLKLEYRFSQFNSENVFDERCSDLDLEPSAHTARLVLSYKLGHRD